MQIVYHVSGDIKNDIRCSNSTIFWLGGASSGRCGGRSDQVGRGPELMKWWIYQMAVPMDTCFHEQRWNMGHKLDARWEKLAAVNLFFLEGEGTACSCEVWWARCSHIRLSCDNSWPFDWKYRTANKFWPATHLKFNIATANISSQKKTSLPTIIFQWLC